MDDAASQPETKLHSPWVLGGLILFGLLAALVTYEASASLATIAKLKTSQMLAPPPEALATAGRSAVVRPVLRTVKYFAIVWPALAFGVLIGAAVRAVVPASWVARLVGGPPLRSQLRAGRAGAPLMLCSCCIAPVYAAVQQRTRRPGPATALMLASPSPNPAALVLTFMLFTTSVAVVRLVMALALVFGVSRLAARRRPAGEVAPAACQLEAHPARNVRDPLAAFNREAWRLARTALPLILAGVVLSSLPVALAPVAPLGDVPLRLAVVALVALVSVPLALPTFAEIPLALGLLAAGAPAGAAVALLIADPAINLPSLLTVGRTTTPGHAVALGVGTFVVALGGGLLV